MGIVGRNFHADVVWGLAIATQSLTALATVNGSTILNPWKKGRQISFLLIGGAAAATSIVTFKVQQQRISDNAWVDMKRPDNVTNLTFDNTKTRDLQALENGVLVGTLDMGPIDTDTYKAIRLVAVESGNATFLISAAYIISDLYTHPSTMIDELWSLQRY